MFRSIFSSSCKEFGTEAKFEHTLVPPQARFPDSFLRTSQSQEDLCTRVSDNDASVPKNVKNGFHQEGAYRPERFYRDENFRNKDFCTESQKPDDCTLQQSIVEVRESQRKRLFLTQSKLPQRSLSPNPVFSAASSGGNRRTRDGIPVPGTFRGCCRGTCILRGCARRSPAPRRTLPPCP